MNLRFYKYHGAGNDFIIVDDRKKEINLTEKQIRNLCHRQLGIGADGFMLLAGTDHADFEMIYYNADGRIGSFCGNGGRCIVDFAYRILKITGRKTVFKAADGIHEAEIQEGQSLPQVALSMRAVKNIQYNNEVSILDTGSPHYVLSVNNLQDFPVFEKGREIRRQEQFPEGINVNFVEKKNNILHLRTYERGVEQETLACGTGVTAVAIASTGRQTGKFEVSLQTKNEDLFEVTFEKLSSDSASNIILKGPARFVFEGIINIS